MSHKKNTTRELNTSRVLSMIKGQDCEFDEVVGEHDFSIKRNDLFYIISLDSADKNYISISLSIAMDEGVSGERSFEVVNKINSTYKIVKCFTIDRGPHVALTLACEIWLKDDSDFSQVFERTIGSINSALAEVNQDFPGII